MSVITSVAPDRLERRSSRIDARYVQWSLSAVRRVRACGRFASSDQGVAVKAAGSVVDGTRVAGLGGVQSCGSVWACPVCAAQIQSARQAELTTALILARMLGYEVLFLTLTMRHQRDHRLLRLWDHLSVAWRATTAGSGRAWKSDKDEYGIAGYVRLVEVTHGEKSGWHVHVHALLFLDPYLRAQEAARVGEQLDIFGNVATRGTRRIGPCTREEVAAVPAHTDEQVNALGMRLFDRWRGALDYKGIRPSVRRGVDIKRVRSDDVIAEYFAKNIYDRKGESSTAHDVTGAHSKTAKNGNRTPFGILSALVDVRSGEVPASFDRDLELWNTYEQVSAGRRQLLWSPGLRGRLQAPVEKTDQEIVEEDQGGDLLEWVTPAEFKYLTERLMVDELLRAAEADDTGEALCAFLNLRVRPYKPDL